MASSKSREDGLEVPSHSLGGRGQRGARRSEREGGTQKVECRGAPQLNDHPAGVALEDVVILAEAVVVDLEGFVLDAPMPPKRGQQGGRPLGLRPQAGRCRARPEPI